MISNNEPEYLSIILSFDSNDDEEEIIDDEDWDDDGPENDPLERSLPTEEIIFPEDD